MARRQTIKHFVISAICLCVAAACTSNAATNDFDLVCKYFAELKADPASTNMTPIERNQVIMAKLTNHLAKDSNALIAWQAISHAQASERYELFRSAAEASEIENWECSPMQELAGKTGEFE